MVQVELRDRTSIFLSLSASKRSEADSGTYSTLDGSLKIAAASARQKSTSKPDQSPLSSLIEKPAIPWLTPQISVPRSCTDLSVWAPAGAPASAASPRAAAAARSGVNERMKSLEKSRASRVQSSAQPVSERHRLFDDHLRSHRHAIEEIGHVLVDEAEAARRYSVADRLRLVGAVNAIDGLAQIKGARAHRIAGAPGHEARQIGLALDHLRRRAPVGPFLLARYLLQARPLEAVAPDADPVAKRPVVRLYEVEEALAGIDDDRAGLLAAAEKHFLLFVDAAQLLLVRGGHIARLIDDVHVDLLRRSEDPRKDERGRRNGASHSRPQK